MVIVLIEEERYRVGLRQTIIRIFPIPKKNIPRILVFGIPRSRPTPGGVGQGEIAALAHHPESPHHGKKSKETAPAS